MQNNLWQPADPGPYSGLPGGGQPYGLPHGTPASGPPSQPPIPRLDALQAEIYAAWIPPWVQPPQPKTFTPPAGMYVPPWIAPFQDTTAWQPWWGAPPQPKPFTLSGPPSVPVPYRADGVLAKLLDAWAPVWQAPPALPRLTLAPLPGLVPFTKPFQDTTAWQQPWVQPPPLATLTLSGPPSVPLPQGFVLRDITAWLPPWTMPPALPYVLPASRVQPAITYIFVVNE